MEWVRTGLLLIFFRRSFGQEVPLPNINDLTTPVNGMDQEALNYIAQCVNARSSAYFGCFTDTKNPKLLIYFSHIDVKLTPESCVDKCKHSGYTYAGMEYSAECYCGGADTILNNQLDEESCDMPCMGDPSKKCGGNGKISVYKIAESMPLPPHCPHIPSSGSYIGCFKDSVTSRLLERFFDNVFLLTPDHCIHVCKIQGYAYAGLEFRYECYCGSRNTVLNNPLDGRSCNMPCGGNQNEMCGGDRTISVYLINDPLPPRVDSGLTTPHDDYPPWPPREPDYTTPSGGHPPWPPKVPDLPTPTDRQGQGGGPLPAQCQCVPPINSATGCYIGCFKDNAKRLLKFYAGESPSITQEYCIDLCKNGGYNFAGVENGNQCFCGSEYTIFGNPSNDKACGMPCAGDNKQLCGGDWRISVYSVNVCPSDKPLLPKCRSLPPTYSYMGCYDNSGKTRLLSYFYGSLDGLTPEFCINTCKKLGHSFAGLEAGSKCFCGNGSTTLHDALNEISCNTPCIGDKNLICGGEKRISVYSMDDGPRSMPLLPQCQSLPSINSYIGCYEDSQSTRLLTAHYEKVPLLTIQYCINVCKLLGYVYAGVKSGNECYCGTATTIFVNPAHERSCGTRCAGDHKQICGDNNRISVYAVYDGQEGILLQPDCQCVPLIDSYIGCYRESHGKLLKDHFEVVPALTPQYCIKLCKVLGYVLAGLESGHHCHCGSASTVLKNPLDESSCQMSCVGDKKQVCGGDLTLGVYSVNGFP